MDENNMLWYAERVFHAPPSSNLHKYNIGEGGRREEHQTDRKDKNKRTKEQGDNKNVITKKKN